jgi:histidyl-tRNA synthetase
MADMGRTPPARTIGMEPPRGMRDILPNEAELRDRAAGTILAVYRRFGFRRIETPALEHIELLTRGEGGENEKLIFKVLKRGERLDLGQATREADLVDLGLRFDLTVPLARYYAHNHAKLPKPLRVVQIGPVWRAERPQRGRYRQFTQCDIDILGVASPVAEMELILATTEALAELGLTGLTVRLNDRRLLGALARWCGFAPDRHDSVFITLDKWDKLEPGAIREELERAGHRPEAIARMLGLFTDVARPRGLDAMREVAASQGDPAAVDDVARIVCALGAEAAGRFEVAFDPMLVRGMSYYTGPIFEITTAGFPSSIAGGGRYDKMIGKILNQDVPATGFSIGFERVVSLLLDRPGHGEPAERRVAVLFDEGTGDLGPVLRAARRLRGEGHLVSLTVRAKRPGAQAAQLEAQGFDGLAEVDGAEGVPQIRWFARRRAGDTSRRAP